MKSGPLERLDVPALAAVCTDRCYNQTRCRVSDAVVRLGVVQGEYEDCLIEPGPGQVVVIPRGMTLSITRAGKSLPATQRRRLEVAKDELRRLHRKDRPE